MLQREFHLIMFSVENSLFTEMMYGKSSLFLKSMIPFAIL